VLESSKHLVAKLKATRDRKIAQGIQCGGRKTYADRSPELVAAAKALRAERPQLSLRKIAARLTQASTTHATRNFGADPLRRARACSFAVVRKPIDRPRAGPPLGDNYGQR
jgi:hypothetical protein